MPRLMILLLSLTFCLAACASVPAATAETVTFAPSLMVDLAAMERLPSGVYIRDVRVGEGNPVRAGDVVAVHYAGWLPDGTLFDGLAPPTPPTQFRLGAGEVIRGWDTGMPGMSRGGQRMLVVPASMAYGRERVENVPANSVLVFLIEIAM
ncbi:FKBP-type peptidyl-prolyl cis-trans isomerase [soil metagenome]